MPGFEPWATGCNARTLSIVLCGLPRFWASFIGVMKTAKAASVKDEINLFWFFFDAIGSKLSPAFAAMLSSSRIKIISSFAGCKDSEILIEWTCQSFFCGSQSVVEIAPTAGIRTWELLLSFLTHKQTGRSVEMTTVKSRNFHTYRDLIA